MKEQDLCVRMSKAEFEAALATAVTYSHQEATNYEVGQMVFYNDSWFMKTNAKTSCNYSLGAGWKQVVVTDSKYTKGNQDFDANGQPYTASNPAPEPVDGEDE